MPTSSTDLRAYLGIDVAKLKLDVVFLLEDRHIHRIFANTAEGFAALHAWIQEQGAFELSVCLESTGSYSDAIVRFLQGQSYHVSLLNPAVLVSYRKTKNMRRKTDKVDAYLLALYGKDEQPAAWLPISDEVMRLRSLLAYRDDLVRTSVQERNRLKAGRLDASLVQVITEHVSWLAERQKGVQHSIKQLLEHSVELKTPWERLQTIPGFGWYASASFIAHLGAIARFPKVGAVVSLAGLSVTQFSSGSSVYHKGHIDRHGRQPLRSLLYLCTLAALRSNAALRTWAERLQQRGKPKKIVLVAVMRKLLHIAYGVWKNDQDYDPAVAFALAA
jgi:transposase